MTDTFTTRWDDHFQNWPGRLAYLEERAVTPQEIEERDFLREARELGEVTIERKEK